MQHLGTTLLFSASLLQISNTSLKTEPKHKIYHFKKKKLNIFFPFHFLKVGRAIFPVTLIQPAPACQIDSAALLSDNPSLDHAESINSDEPSHLNAGRHLFLSTRQGVCRELIVARLPGVLNLSPVWGYGTKLKLLPWEKYVLPFPCFCLRCLPCLCF